MKRAERKQYDALGMRALHAALSLQHILRDMALLDRESTATFVKEMGQVLRRAVANARPAPNPEDDHD
jgi:hypothetical protein